MKKENKIMVVVSGEEKTRLQMIKRLAIDLGFAITVTDAGKIIKATPHDFDLSQAYFVLAGTYNFRESPATTQKLYELAARGICVIVGVKKMYPEFEFICSQYYPSDFGRL